MPRRSWARVGWLVAAVLATGCLLASEVVERVGQGPRAQELFYYRIYMVNGRDPNFDERRKWEDALDERVSRYMREHPEIEQATRYSDFRFWRQVVVGSTRGEVRALLEEPDEQSMDPALMGAMAQQHWPAIQRRAKEAWVYPPGWVLYFDDKAVVDITRKKSPYAPTD
jgi:hypothetical protein